MKYGVAGIRTAAGLSIAIIGAGDVAFDFAMTLSKRNDVVILQRGERPGCNAVLERRAAASERVTVLENAEAWRISRASSVFGLSLRGAGCGGSLDRMTADHVIVAIGRVPREMEFMPPLAEAVDDLVAAGRLRFAGDVRNGIHRQTAIAVGDGVRAAMEIHESKGADGQ